MEKITFTRKCARTFFLSEYSIYLDIHHEVHGADHDNARTNGTLFWLPWVTIKHGTVWRVFFQTMSLGLKTSWSSIMIELWNGCNTNLHRRLLLQVLTNNLSDWFKKLQIVHCNQSSDSSFLWKEYIPPPGLLSISLTQIMISTSSRWKQK